MERLFSTVSYFLSHFWWSVNYMSRVSKFHNFFLTYLETEARCIFERLDLWPVLILEIFSCWDNKKGQFQYLVTLLVVFFLVCKLHKSGFYIIISFEHGKYFIWRILVFSFLVFSFFKYLKFSFSSNISCSGNVKVLVCKLYMPVL